MFPVLFTLGGLAVPSYAAFMLLAFVVVGAVRRGELARLGHERLPGYALVNVGALVGAAVGAKLGMILFEPPQTVADLLRLMLALDFTGKTVVGGIAGGYLGVELAKKAVGITRRTGDGFAVALPLGQAIGRVGCFLNGCCYGSEWQGPWAVTMAGASRHPAQLYEAALDVLLALALWSMRLTPRPEGNLFRRYLVGYALIRFVLEPIRGDNGHVWMSLTLVQWACAATMLGFGAWIWRTERPALGA
jgi:phosphatidylglycerol:prolipoprotein diacylglycerol transferase